MKNLYNLYIHIPFCISKCNYCAFFSMACKNPNWDAFQQQITSEIADWGNKLENATLVTIFFGGGTPSLMPTDVFKNILNQIQHSFQIANNCEITTEANPGTIDTKKIQELKSMGFTRMSVG